MEYKVNIGNIMKKAIIYMLLISGLVACQTTPPQKINNICDIFAEKTSWYKHARNVEDKWGVPVSVLMAVMRYESAFKSDAKTPYKTILGIPTFQRVSSAEGYSQALDGTWKEYKKDTGRSFVSRSNFADSADFMGWYMHKSHTSIGISKSDAYRQYLAYHEGQAGYKRGNHKRKSWLRGYARKVGNQAGIYSIQLNSCS